MFDSIVLNIVIGLVFIYLLYSLFATVVLEIIATNLGLRARNLKQAVNRMLVADNTHNNWFQRLCQSLRLLYNPRNYTLDAFYDHPEIKYLSNKGVFRHPSNFKADSFSRVVINLILSKSVSNKNLIKDKLEQLATKFDEETSNYLLELWYDCEEDVSKFRISLENWFDKTMEQATEWYKRKIQLLLFILGFFIAWIFNADTFTIIDKLSKDKAARNGLVNMASAFVSNNPTQLPANIIDTADIASYNQRLDSLLNIKKQLEHDIKDANSLLGTGAWLPDSIIINKSDSGLDLNNEFIDLGNLPSDKINASVLGVVLKSHSCLCTKKLPAKKNWLFFNTCEKWEYLFGLLARHFFGYLVTATAISLGAPFWFDLLNKLTKLRSPSKP